MLTFLVVIGLLGFLGVLAAVVISIYNGLVRARNTYKNAFAQIDVQLQRRFDLIPNLVETVKTYIAHERQTLEAVIAARNAAQSGLAAAKADPGNAEKMAQLAASQGALDGVLGRLMMVAEAYPELKANENMMQLSEELSSTENRVAFARQAYNDMVMEYNNRCQTFPANLISGMFNFSVAALLEIPAEQTKEVRQAPKIKFD